MGAERNLRGYMKKHPTQFSIDTLNPYEEILLLPAPPSLLQPPHTKVNFTIIPQSK